MAVVRVQKNKDYTAMGNYHLKEKDMSLKAIGLLSIMLSLPDNWDYSIKGLVKIRKESYDSIRTTLKELEQFGYLRRTQIYDKGKFVDVEYTIYEKPILENPITEKPITENPTQLNTKEVNTNLIKELNNNKEKNIKKKVFTKPTLEEVEEYCISRDSTVDAKRFYDYYEVADWDGVKNWKQKLITWESHQPKKKVDIDDIDLEKLQKEIDEEERQNEIRRNKTTT